MEFDTCERTCLDDGEKEGKDGGGDRLNGTKQHGTRLNEEQQTQSPTDLNNKWAEWGAWSPCSVSCGAGGMRQRMRDCMPGADCGGGVGVELEECKASVECGSDGKKQQQVATAAAGYLDALIDSNN